jgi:hypothetical protein
MPDLVGLLKALLEFANGLRVPIRVALVQPMITVGLLLLLYTGWHVQNEGNLLAGLRVAFLDTQASRATRNRDVEAAILRAELYQAAETDKLIEQLMTALLQHAGSAARVRLGVIHNGVSGVTGIGLLRYDITNAVAATGHTAGVPTQNQPLSEWSAILPMLLAGRCVPSAVDQLPNLTSRARLQSMGATGVLACPVSDVHGTLLGCLFVVWDSGDVPPAGAQLAALMEFSQRIGGQIAAALDLLVPTPRLGDAARPH